MAQGAVKKSGKRSQAVSAKKEAILAAALEAFSQFGIHGMQQDPQGFFSWVLKPDHTAGQRRLTLAGQQGQQFAVEKGLQAGEQVITDGAQRLREGAAVQVLN